MKYCTKCGVENAAEASFCCKCGESLSQPTQEVVDQSPPKSPRFKKSIVIAILAAVLALGAIFGTIIHEQVQERRLEEQRQEKIDTFENSTEYSTLVSVLNSNFGDSLLKTRINEETMTLEISVSVEVPSSAFSNYLIKSTWDKTVDQMENLTSTIYTITSKYEFDSLFTVYSSDSKELLIVKNQTITYNIVD